MAQFRQRTRPRSSGMCRVSINWRTVPSDAPVYAALIPMPILSVTYGPRRSAGECETNHHLGNPVQVPGNLWRGSQYLLDPICIVCAMSAKYYTQFRLNDTSYQGGNEFSGVVELNRPIDQDWEIADIEAVLAKNFDLQQNDVTLLSWSRLH